MDERAAGFISVWRSPPDDVLSSIISQFHERKHNTRR